MIRNLSRMLSRVHLTFSPPDINLPVDDKPKPKPKLCRVELNF